MLEETDQKILALLNEDGRTSYTDIGRAVGMSTSTVHQRVKRLERRGLITGYTALVDHEQLGLPLTAFVGVTAIEPDDQDCIERLAELPEIEACWSVAGDESFLVKVRVASPTDLEGLLARIRKTARVSTRTTVVLSTPFENRPVLRADRPTRSDTP
ncbi:Lrp/AsnC family transcriptional regulator [Nocardioides limicola]|uniref:Lrp/AsnC family transcriptional regulator n=1 Tax=Nocardioides limicola TaxID=2803368 RepID=UPI0027DE6DDD|nr:AsnC family transcriptional regulator [Nocardioides sp. DJM-14]